MPRKQQGWITFQASEEERQLLEHHCQRLQRSKTEVLRELLRSLNPPTPNFLEALEQEDSGRSPEAQTESLSLTPPDKAMRVSARNVFKGTIKRMAIGIVNTEVTLEIVPSVEITSTITKTSAEELGLAEGQTAYAVIKASSVMMAVD